MRQATALVLLSILVAGCGSFRSPPAGSSTATGVTQPRPAQSTAGSTPNATRTDIAVIRRHGFVPSDHHAATPDSFGQMLYAWRATCAGSADGYCQQVFFFVDRQYIGTDTRSPSLEILRVAPAGIGAIAVVYAHYRAGDPNCCPSGRPITVIYRLKGTRLVASGHAPGH